VATRVAGVRKADDLWLVPVHGDPLPPVGTAVRGALQDDRRTALMRTHSGLHLLSGVIFRDYGALVTGGNMEPLEARMDFNLPEVPAGFKERVTADCAAEVVADRAITTAMLPREVAFAAYPDLIRTATNLLPDHLEVVRVVDIADLDTQADAGTHVASTAAIGRIEIVKIENKGKGFRRLRVRLAD
jgi:misacylated tRNA(Ala) deacylase